MQFEAHYSSEVTSSAHTATASPEPRPASRISSNREVAVVQADYVALANDLEQAHALTCTLELQLSGKVNELAQFKHLWERTRGDLQKFERDLEVLRRERHGLANEVQRAYAVEFEFEKLKRNHEELKARAAKLEAELGSERVLHADARRNVADLKEEIEQVRQRSAANSPHAKDGLDADTRATLQVLRKHLEKILAGPDASSPTQAAAPRPAPDTERIEISYEA